MMTPFPPKTPKQMRPEAQGRAIPAPKPRAPGKTDTASRPQLTSGDGGEAEAASGWIAHLEAGRIRVR